MPFSKASMTVRQPPSASKSGSKTIRGVQGRGQERGMDVPADLSQGLRPGDDAGHGFL